MKFVNLHVSVFMPCHGTSISKKQPNKLTNACGLEYEVMS